MRRRIDSICSASYAFLFRSFTPRHESARTLSLARTLSPSPRVAVVALVQHVVGRLVRGRGREAAPTENLGHPRHLGAGQDRGGDAGDRGCEAARRGHRGRRWRDRAHVQRVREAPDEAAARDARANLREAATARRLGGVGELGSGSSVLAVPLCQQHGEPAAPTTVPTTVPLTSPPTAPLTAPLTAPPCPPPWAACTWRPSLRSDTTPTPHPTLTSSQVRQPHEGLPTGAGHSAATSGASQGAESGGQCGGAAGGSEPFNWKKSIKTQLKVPNPNPDPGPNPNLTPTLTLTLAPALTPTPALTLTPNQVEIVPVDVHLDFQCGLTPFWSQPSL